MENGARCVPTLRKSMHVLLLPKWYPGRNDPQLGDFLRKQAWAAGKYVRMSVLYAEPITGAGLVEDEVVESSTAWELTVRYRACTSALLPWRKVVNLWRYWRSMQRGWRRVMEERGVPEVLHAYILVRPVLFAYWKSRRYRMPLVVSEQSSEYVDGTYAAKGFLFHRLSRSLFAKAEAVTSVSSWLGDALVGHELCKRYAVVPNVVPGLDRALPPSGRPGHFLVVADLVDRTKNVSGVLRALQAARHFDPSITLTIIGDGPDRTALEHLCDTLNLREAVEFLGRVPNTVVLDRMASIFAVIINSNVETFSVVTGEALAQGKPVIATRCGGPIAFITDTNGILIDVGADGALAEAMLRLTREANRYDPVTIRRTVSDRFSPEAVGAAFHTIYRSALQ